MGGSASPPCLSWWRTQVADSFGSVWKSVRLHAGDPPALLARYWVLQAWRRICSLRGWSFLRSETQFLISASRTATVSATRGSVTLTGAGGFTFLAADVQRQIRFGTDFPQTILAVDLILNTATLDRAYSGTSSAAATGTILDCYITCPSDFGSFVTVVDPSAQLSLQIWSSQQEIDRVDPQRSYSGMDPYVLAPIKESSAGLLRYELWPYPTSEKALHAYYLKSPTEILDEEFFPGVFAERTDVLVTGALAEAASWPGTFDQKNPYFNLSLAAAKRGEFLSEVKQLILRDEERYLTWMPNFRPAVIARPELAAYERNHE